MIQRERPHDAREQRMGVPAAGGTSLLASAQGLLERGRDAIDRALSQDSQGFLDAIRQEGGQ